MSPRPIQNFKFGLSLLQVHSRFFAIVAGFDIIAKTLFFFERLHTSSLNRCNVHEAVVAAIFRCDKAIAFVRVEEFYCSCRHIHIPVHLMMPGSATCATGRVGQSREREKEYAYLLRGAVTNFRQVAIISFQSYTTYFLH